MSSGAASLWKPATNSASIPSATQCAAVRIRSPLAESSTAPLQVCSEPPPRKTAPTRGSGATGCAVAGAVMVGDGVLLRRCRPGARRRQRRKQTGHHDQHCRRYAHAHRSCPTAPPVAAGKPRGRAGSAGADTGTPGGMRHPRRRVRTIGWAAMATTAICGTLVVTRRRGRWPTTRSSTTSPSRPGCTSWSSRHPSCPRRTAAGR